MDCSDEESDSDLGAISCREFRNVDSLPSTNNILKPQIDKIFSEVQKNLPTIDFDSSDVSSDNDEPIFFHQNLKLNSWSAGFDDDKDLDTSLSQGEAHALGLGSLASVDEDSGVGSSSREVSDHFHNLNRNAEKEGSHSVDLDNEEMFRPAYDNDLAALMSQVKFPSADDVVSWQRISLKNAADEEKLTQREEEDLQRSRRSYRDHSPSSITNNGSNKGSNFDSENNSHSYTSNSLNIEDVDVEISNPYKSINRPYFTEGQSDNDTIIPSPESSQTEKNLHGDIHHGRLKDLSDDRKQIARQHDREIVSTLTSEERTHLSFRMFEELDLDSILNAANESNISLDSLRVVGRPLESQIPKSHDGGGDRKGATGSSEDLTLMQKLGQLSMTQRGAEVMPGVKIDPKTGAAILQSSDSRLIYNQIDSDKQKHGAQQSKSAVTPVTTDATGATSVGGTAVRSKFASCGTGPDLASHAASSQTQGSITSNMGTSTASGVTTAKILYGRLQNEKREVSPPTVFIDLRGFEQQKEEEKQGLQSVQRVLGINTEVEDSSSSDSDEEEMVERCNWRQTRQQLKQNLVEQGPAAAETVLRNAGKASQRQGRPLGYTKPPRVINLQEHAASKKWATNVSKQGTLRREGLRDMEEEEEEEEGQLSEEERRKQEEDNRVRQAKIEAEKEKERQREKARQIREAREKERERRTRMSKQVEAARSTASTQGKQSTGENTPALFDIEVSYEPSPCMLPPNLQPETETLLLTIHLSGNGEIVQHRKRSNKSVDTGSGLSATYTALLSWLLSLVPSSSGGSDTGSNVNAEKENNSNSSFGNLDPEQVTSTFNVVGLQQTWQDEELKLNVVISPSEKYLKAESAVKYSGRSSKGKSDQMKGSSKFGQYMSKFLSVNTLYSVCPWLESLVSVTMKSERQEEKGAAPFHYTPSLPDISSQPLATFIQVNPDPQAAGKIFNIPVGFYWQTVDSGEAWHTSLDCRDSHVTYETQNTMSLVYNDIFHNPLSLMAILNRVAQEGLDLAGIRLLYPSADMLAADHPNSSSSVQGKEPSTSLGPVLALALRGTFARSIWLDAVGPSDPCLARRTDPNSLCAQFGGESRERALLFCPRNPSRVQSELTRWFGGRVTEGTVSLDVGIPYTKKDEARGKKKNKKGTAQPASASTTVSTEPHRPPAALAATAKSDIFLVLSPLLPPSYLGVVMATAQRRGFQVRGVRRARLSARIATSLGIKSGLQPLYCPGAKLEDYHGERPVEALAPCTVFMLRKENAAHNTPSLIEAFMVQLTLAGLLGCVQMRLDEPLTSQHLFQACTFSEGLLAALGGDMAKSPDLDLSHLSLSSAAPAASNKKGVEQMAVIILLGHEMLKKCGVITSKLLNVLPYSSKAPTTPTLPDRPELLGLKWTPGLSMHQAKELSPYEVGDRRWKGSVKQLASEPALVLAIRGVDVFARLKPIIDQQQKQQQDKSQKTSGKVSASGQKNRPEVLMSSTSSESDIYARLFFHPNELYPDPLARSLLPFLPEARLYFNIVDSEANDGGPPTRLFSLKPTEELDLTQERVLEEATSGQQPINTLLLVKPQAASRFMSRVMRKVIQEQFKVVGLRLLCLSPDQAQRLVPASQRQDDCVVQQHITALTSGPSLVLALQGSGAVKRLLDLLGPEDPQSARRLSQFLWRGEFGRDGINNGLYCSSSYIDAVEDIHLFFPDGLCCEESELLAFEQIVSPAEDREMGACSNHKREAVVISTTPPAQSNSTSHDISVQDIHQMLLQTTCLLLTPPLLQARFKGREVPAVDVMAMLLNNGFELVGARQIWMTQRQAETYLAVRGEGSFQQVGFLCSGPCIVLAAQRDNAVLAFDSILNQSSESLRLMKEHGDFIIRPHSIKMSQSLLALFFDHLMPSSQMTIRQIVYGSTGRTVCDNKTSH